MMCFWKEAAVDSMPTAGNTIPEALKTDPEGGAGDTPLDKASLWALTAAMGMKLVRGIPFVGPMLAPVGVVAEYSGRPQDYRAKFDTNLQYFSYWPAEAKQW